MHIAHIGACAIFSRCNTIHKAGLLPRHYYFLKQTSITLYIYTYINMCVLCNYYYYKLCEYYDFVILYSLCLSIYI